MAGIVPDKFEVVHKLDPATMVFIAAIVLVGIMRRGK